MHRCCYLLRLANSKAGRPGSDLCPRPIPHSCGGGLLRVAVFLSPAQRGWQSTSTFATRRVCTWADSLRFTPCCRGLRSSETELWKSTHAHFFDVHAGDKAEIA